MTGWKDSSCKDPFVRGKLFPAKKPFSKNIPPNFVFSVLGYILSTGNSRDSDSLIGRNYSLMEEVPKLERKSGSNSARKEVKADGDFGEVAF